MIYELPMVLFPEEPSVYQLADYQSGLGYFYTRGLRWSYGGVKGRNWAAALQFFDEGMSLDFVRKLINTGYRGLYIDTRGFADQGKEVISFYSDELGLVPIVSENGMLYYYDLAPLGAI